MNCFNAGFFSVVMSWVPSWPVIICLMMGATLAAAVLWLHFGRAAPTTRHEKLAADLAEKAPAGLLQVGADGIIQWANLAELELLGYARQEYVGKRAAEFYGDASEGLNVLGRLARGETLRDYPTNLRA